MKPSKTLYGNIHTWLKTKYGKADKCENPDCDGSSKAYEWSLIFGKGHERNRNNYQMLCHSCHYYYDKVLHATEKEKRNMNQETLRPCGHRISEKHFIKIRKIARKFNLKEAEALRKILDNTYAGERSINGLEI